MLTVRDGVLSVLTAPSALGGRALPGGLATPDEPPEATARRVLRGKAGLPDLYLEQLGAFAAPDRDPRGWIPAIAYLALVPPPTAAGEPGAAWVPARDPAPALDYDHPAILAAAVERLEGKLWWSNVAVGILPGAFTLSDARAVYAAVAGRAYDPATFARDLKATGLVTATGEQRADGPGRPAALYRFTDRDLRWGAGRRKRVAPA